jgi:hypothetical protein
MTAWTSDELTKIGTADELLITSLRRDGTLRNPVTVWVLRHGDDLYVRSVSGMRMSESLLCLGARDVVLIALADHLGGISQRRRGRRD